MSISSVNGVASTVSRYRFVAAGGETSLSGTDANGATLSYLIGKEEVYLNGALLVRGQDYTGTDGATISSLTALVAGDTVEIITFVPFAIPTAISSATVTTAGDLIVATGASAVTRLGVGSSGTILTSNGTTPAYTSTVTGTLNNGTLTGTLTAASTSGTSGQFLSSTGSGVQWATPASGSMTLLSTTTLSGTSITVTGISQGYTDLLVLVNGFTFSSNDNLYVQPNSSAGSQWMAGVTSDGTAQTVGDCRDLYGNYAPSTGSSVATAALLIRQYTSTNLKPIQWSSFQYVSAYKPVNFAGACWVSSAITSMNFSTAGASFTAGTARIYGIK